MTQKSTPTAPNTRTFSKSRFPHSLFLESYGVTIRIGSNESAAIDAIGEMLPSLLPECHRLIDEVKADHKFFYVWNRSKLDSVYKNGEKVMTRRLREHALDQLNSGIRLTVAEFAVERVFVHAGVVGWKGKALIIPAPSFSGKSALVAELVRRGALYYSDEYAVLDKNGLVSPFPKMLSIRGEIDDYQQIEYPVKAFGGTAGTEGIPVGMVLITKYKRNAKWRPQVLSSGKGLMEIIRNTVPIQKDPSFSLSVLNKVAKNSSIVKSSRGEVSEFADHILQFFESECL